MKNRNPMLRLIDNITVHDKKQYLLCAAYTVFAICVPLISVLFPRVIIGYLISGQPTAAGIAAISAGAFLAGGFCTFFEKWFWETGYPSLTALRIGYVGKQAEKLMDMDYKYIESARFFDEYQMGLESISNSNNGVEGIYHKLFELPKLVLIVPILAIFIGLKSPVILIAMLVHMAVSAFLAVHVQKYAYSRKEEREKQERHVSYYARTAKDFAFGKDIRLYDLKERITDNFKKAIQGYSDILKAIKNREYFLGFFSLLTLFLSDAAVYGVLTLLTVQGMTIADYSMYIAAAVALSAQMTLLTDSVTFILDQYQYVKDFFRFMDGDFGEKGGDREAEAGAPEIEFRDVTFRYPGADKNVLEHFSLKIPSGQKLALVGVNGAGKTTFVKLLTGLFQADSGGIFINGHRIEEYKKSALYGMFAAVFQEVNILAFTVAQNIACSLKDIDYKKVDDVLRQVGLYDKVHNLQNGADTMMLKVIEDDGALFSGGESQKLVIARALYKGGGCIIMDEPTASLDALAEAEIYSEFGRLTQGKTSVYISHRLASTKFCDEIALLDGAHLGEYGTHDELMVKQGKYYQMFVAQGKYYQKNYGEDAPLCGEQA